MTSEAWSILSREGIGLWARVISIRPTGADKTHLASKVRSSVCARGSG